jgi:hypothetical protein
MTAEKGIYQVYYDANARTVIMEWTGYATSQQFKEGTELMLETLVNNHTNKVLADIRDMTLIGLEDQQWLEKQFLPRAIESGFRALAILRPSYYFNKVAVESVSYKVDQDKLRIAFFDNRQSAEQWLAVIE